ncbi:DUF6907 domain-containing protein [Streptomyces rapamycinicus]|uniref:Uncharacterized protein n=2 Tax=Streptomyces rapamycinicus TaxID=1226757 RepID=A0A0A0NJ73_STRRN|nr:hypothetical protein [Streptomyces rapamycinicus]AGP56158.1 hypothetical protein M271_23220 [Streptomyces rapamycinicus NRRL 5491]MBB4783764.1 hypothetical protein [Streptomyces rapamycinicus]RLV80765.1 hypothetical protein D3C57_120310 [Streptomyces rapamycinicus NRRL 5491]UTO64121.1 hypothetical protein LJB45_18515 [Streptomyces rapamycinicus]UTP32076.1 hypothetical protein LIV37_23635 [Streptomyces rapamycinicus NRRL 5491]
MQNLTRASVPATTDRRVPAMVTTTAPQPAVDCPDRIAWCLGDPRDHSDPREHLHKGPEQSISGAYGENLLGFHLTRWDDDTPVITFEAGGQWQDLSLSQMDELISDGTGHFNALRAARAQLAALIDQDHAAPAEPRTFTFPLRDGGTLTETCPPDCNLDHQPQTELREVAEDIWHHIGDQPSLTLTVFDAEDGTAEDQFLSAQVTVAPHESDPRLCVPHVNVEIAQDYAVMEGMTPDEFGAVIDKLAAHVDQLRRVHAQLVQARADWQAHA